MTKNLVTRAQFAQLANVSGAAVTKACDSALKAACSGKRIDANHPDAKAYIEKQAKAKTPGPAEGIDALYADALDACRQSGKWSERFLRATFSIGSSRATRIIAQMKASGLYGTPATAGTATRQPHVRGQAAVKEKRKAAPPPEAEGGHEVPEHLEAFADYTLRQIIEQFGTDTRFVDWLKAVKSIEDINEKRIKNAAARGELVNRYLVQTQVIDPINTAHLRLMKDGAKSIAAAVVTKHQAGISLAEIEAHVSDTIGSFIQAAKRKIGEALSNE